MLLIVWEFIEHFNAYQKGISYVLLYYVSLSLEYLTLHNKYNITSVTHTRLLAEKGHSLASEDIIPTDHWRLELSGTVI
jgi:hypothetical protein